MPFVYKQTFDKDLACFHGYFRNKKWNTFSKILCQPISDDPPVPSLPMAMLSGWERGGSIFIASITGISPCEKCVSITYCYIQLNK